ncbi:MAG: Succinate--CoA ligase [ADP-forming] subunit alpha [Elusimicrobia bacterium]|nr:Succinate--CoA ligase [ADP-forming] subunit alpha [Elusimicrobiota bacterium]
MSILLDTTSRVICQGITGAAGSFHTKLCKEYGTKMVGGVTPGKGGSQFEGIPIYDTVDEAVIDTQANVSMIFVPAPLCAEAILEAMEAGIQLIVAITEGIPVMDMVKVKHKMTAWNKGKKAEEKVRLIGPNCPGVITVDACKVGIMPGYIHKKGPIGIVSRSGTLTYEAVWQLTKLGIGQSTVVGIGGDPVNGTDFVDVLELFQKDSSTQAVVMLGEIGGRAEEEAAHFFKTQMNKPLFAFVAGITAPAGKRMGHAGAIVEGGSGKAEDKIAELKRNGVIVAESPATIGITVRDHFVPVNR